MLICCVQLWVLRTAFIGLYQVKNRYLSFWLFRLYEVLGIINQEVHRGKQSGIIYFSTFQTASRSNWCTWSPRKGCQWEGKGPLEGPLGWALCSRLQKQGIHPFRCDPKNGSVFAPVAHSV